MASGQSEVRRSAWRLFVILSLGVFAAEAVIMLLLGKMPAMAPRRAALLDALLLVLALFPVLLIATRRPLLRGLEKRQEDDAGLQESDRRVRSVLETMSLMGLMLDRDGRITLVNDRLLSLTGWRREEVLGARWFDVFLPPEERATIEREVFDRAMRTGEVPAQFENAIVTRAGERRMIRWSNTILRDPDGAVTGVASIGEDVTERQLADAALRGAEQRGRRQRAAMARLVAEDFGERGIAEAARTITEQCAAALEVERASLWLLSEDQSSLDCIALFEASTRRHSDGVRLKAADYPNYFAAIHRESRIAANDARTDPRTSEFTSGYLEPLNIMSMLDAGVAPEGTLAGVVCLEHVATPRQWHADEESFASAIASMTAQLMAIEAQRRTLVALQKSEARFRSWFELPIVGICLTSPTKGWLAVNDHLCAMLGYDRAELSGLSWADLTHPDDLAADEHEFERVLRREIDGYSLEKRFVRKNGTMFASELSVRCVRTSAGSVDYFVALIQDITERKRAELEREVMHDVAQSVATSTDVAGILTRTHAALRQVLTADNCFVALHDADTGLFSFPYHVDQRDETPAPAAMPTSCVAYVFRRGEPALITPDVFRELERKGEVSLIGSPSPSWMGVPLRTPSGMIGVLVVQDYERTDVYGTADLAFFAAVGDQVAMVLERTMAHMALRNSEADLNIILEATADGMLAVDSHGKVLRTNRRFAELWRIPPELLAVGKDEALLQYVVGQVADPEGFLAKVQELYGRTDESRDTVSFTDGRVFERFSAPIKREGELVGRLWSFNDVTARRRAEESKSSLEAQLHHAQKLEAVGRLAGGIAHDFNNMLGAILGTAEIAMEQVEASHPVHEDLREIRRTAQRSAELTRQLLAYARRQTVAPEVLDLNATVQSLLGMLQRLIGEDIAVVWNPASEVWAVTIDPSQVANVLTNLCVNARHAIASHGTISLMTANCTLDEAFCATHADAEPGDYVRLSVRDTGCGMDEATMALVFEPFFTTKGVGEGTGLGLASVYGAVRQNNGFVTVTSAPGKGSTFDVYLPRRAQEVRAARKSGARAAIGTAGSETILLVEDEPAILRLATRVLEARGHTVLAASTPHEALRLAEAHTDEIALLLTDVVMPEMNGRELAETLKARRPSIKLLFMSGHTADVIAHRGMIEPGMAFLEKPFATRMLAEKVRETLDVG